MAQLITGLQGSGKSYYCVHYMHYNRSKYHRIFTNIDGIKQDDKILQIDFKKFIDEILETCYTKSLDGASFGDIVDFLKSVYVLPPNPSKDNRIIFIIDEAQNFFGTSVKLKPSLVWLITQHRHLYIELFVITQKYTLLRRDYHLFNVVIDAYPPIKQINKFKIRYAEFAGTPPSDKNKTRNFSLKKEKEVFKLYVSGDKVDSPNVMARFAIWGGLALLALLYFAFNFVSSFGTQHGEENATQAIIEEVTDKESLKQINTLKASSKPIYTVSHEIYACIRISEDGYFNIDEVSNRTYRIELLPIVKENYFKKILKTDVMGYGITYIYVLLDSNIKRFLVSDEEKNQKTFSVFAKEEDI